MAACLRPVGGLRGKAANFDHVSAPYSGIIG